MVGWLFFFLLGAAQYTPFHGDPKYLLEGNWQSCRDDNGQFQEKVYDQPTLGIEIHLGPNDEFAVFRGIRDEHRDHASPQNLLFPTYRVRGGHQRWEFDEAILEVSHAGGSRRECRSYWITLEPKKHTVADR